MKSGPHAQRGVALLVVLILLVMMSALAAKISQRFNRHLQKTHYQMSQQQLRWAIHRQQAALEQRLQSEGGLEYKGLSPEGDWAEPMEMQGDNFTVISQAEDAQNCFNINTLIEEDPPSTVNETGTLPTKSLKEQIAERLLLESGVSRAAIEELYQQIVDYLDADSTTAKGALETDEWVGLVPARQPANQMMRTPGELKRLPAFPQTAWPIASKLFCTLPEVNGKININTVTLEQTPLLSALFTGALNKDEAARLIAMRPKEGWESLEVFNKTLETDYPQTKDRLTQVQEFLAVNSTWFRINSVGNTDDLTLRVVSQLHVDNEAGKVMTWQRRYRMVE